ncbi:hypothetical protein HK096_000740 [Nowakowskiella sp. JEL0078]|nr:hypothetical protein HK096_000740 [Nowakowskiella sp. JEL0078]
MSTGRHWQRLIRFLTADGRVVYGEPTTPFEDAISGASARLISGDPFDQLNHSVSDTIEVVHKILSPVKPPIVLCIGLNYLRHLREFDANATKPTFPVMFTKPPSAVIGPNETIRIPPLAHNQTDYEAELAVVIGRHYKTGAICKHLKLQSFGTDDLVAENGDVILEGSEDDPLAYVAGYTCANDVSARFWQKKIPQWGFSKSFDTFCPLGPQIVSARVISPSDLPISLKLKDSSNIETTQQASSTADLIFSVSKIISFLSQGTTLEPGTVIITGTPEGVGMGRTPPRWLLHGDEATVEITGIGRLKNPVEWQSDEETKK